MSQTGFLLLTLPARYAFDYLGNHLMTAAKYVRQKLYIKFHFTNDVSQPSYKIADLRMLTYVLPSVYAKSSSSCRNLDVRLILDSSKLPSSSQVQVILTDSNETDLDVKKYTQCRVNDKSLNIVRLQKPVLTDAIQENNDSFKIYGTVILGGTFDRLHNGHKVLLSIAALRTTKKLIIGVTDGIMLKHKFLWELIEPINKRIDDVLEFLTDINPSIEYSAVPIYDIYGPTIDPDSGCNCIIVSEETKRGGNKVNEQRMKLNLNPIDMVIVDLVEDEFRNVADEFKVSSSNQRRGLLGTYLKKPEINASNIKTLCIALIGGLHCCSCGFETELRKANIAIVDCEGLFLKDEAFTSILSLIDLPKDVSSRETLHRILLSDMDKQRILQSALPVIESTIQQEISKMKMTGASAVILKIPFYFGQKLLKMTHQVWGTIVPENNRLEYLKKYLNVSDEEANVYLANDISNTDVISLAHMVFCPVGEPSFISIQVQRALKELNLPVFKNSI